jgi:hypothetical protein
MWQHASLVAVFLAIPVAAGEPDAEPVGYTYAFEIMALMNLFFLTLTCYMLIAKICREKTPPKGAVVKVVDSEVQCNLLSSMACEAMPDGSIYFAPSSTRWHDRQDCRHLKCAMKVNRLTPCQTCTR